jgi:hypothetical protein
MPVRHVYFLKKLTKKYYLVSVTCVHKKQRNLMIFLHLLLPPSLRLSGPSGSASGVYPEPVEGAGKLLTFLLLMP